MAEERMKLYIEQNIDLIEDDQWEEFFKHAPEGIGGVLYAAGIDFMRYMEQVPYKCFTESSLTDITIPNSITSIDNNAFRACQSLTSVEIPDSVTSIGSFAFSRCTSLTSIEIPNSVTSIGSQAFSGCRGLTNITIPEGVTDIDFYVFAGCKGLTSIIIPDGVAYICHGAFEDCTGLKSITIPNSVRDIGEEAFNNLGSDVVIKFDGTKEQWKKIYNSYGFKNTYFTVNCLDGALHKKKR